MPEVQSYFGDFINKTIKSILCEESPSCLLGYTKKNPIFEFCNLGTDYVVVVFKQKLTKENEY